jgi:hypothetical protein
MYVYHRYNSKEEMICIEYDVLVLIILLILFVGFYFIDSRLNNQENYNNTNTNGITNNNESLEQKYNKLSSDVRLLKNIVSKLYTNDMNGDYIVHGWFIEVTNVMDSPNGIILSETITKVYGASTICYKTRDSFPFFGTADKPIYLPKSDYVGFRAMTIFKVPKTGHYDFKCITDDGLRFYYLKVPFDVILNEKNVRSKWIKCIDSWFNQAEVWVMSDKFYFNENDYILVRIDTYELTGYATTCVKLRYYGNNGEINERDFPYENSFCSLLWANVPLLGNV